MFGFKLLWVKIFLSHISVLEIGTSVNEEYKTSKYVVEKLALWKREAVF